MHPVAWEPILERASCGLSANSWMRMWHECPLLNVHPVAWVPMIEYAFGMSAHYWTHILWHECPFLNEHVAWHVFMNTHLLAWRERHLFMSWVMHLLLPEWYFLLARATLLFGMTDTFLWHWRHFFQKASSLLVSSSSLLFFLCVALLLYAYSALAILFSSSACLLHFVKFICLQPTYIYIVSITFHSHTHIQIINC